MRETEAATFKFNRHAEYSTTRKKSLIKSHPAFTFTNPAQFFPIGRINLHLINPQPDQTVLLSLFPSPPQKKSPINLKREPRYVVYLRPSENVSDSFARTRKRDKKFRKSQVVGETAVVALGNKRRSSDVHENAAHRLSVHFGGQKVENYYLRSEIGVEEGKGDDIRAFFFVIVEYSRSIAGSYYLFIQITSSINPVTG